MTQRDWRNAEARSIGVFLNGDELQMTTPRGEDVQDDSFLVLFNAHHEPLDVPDADASVRRALAARAVDRGAGAHGDEAPSWAAREELAVESRSIVAAPSRHVTGDFRATYRLQLTPEFGFREARALVPYLERLGVSHLYLSPSFQARDGLDARVRRRRSAPHLRRARRRGGAARARRRRSRRRARHRPEPHGRERREPVLGRSGAAQDVLRPRHAHRAAPALLRHRRARGRARRGRGRVRDDAREGARARARRRRRRAAHRPHRRSREPARVPRPARARGSRARVGGEDPRAGRAASRLAGRGNDGLRVPQRRHAPVPRSARRGAADAALRGAHGRVALVRRDRRRGEARAGDGHVRAGAAAAARRRSRPAEPRPGARVVPRLPDVRRAGERRRRRRGSPRDRARRGLGDARPHPHARGAGPRRFRAPLPADDRPGDGEGRRGHGVLPLQPLRRAERGRRQPRARGRCRSTRSISRTSSAPSASRAGS